MLTTNDKLSNLLNSLSKRGQIILQQGNTDTLITGIAYHSDKVCQNNIFVAIKGYTTDGHLYIDEAIKKGANAIIAEEDFLTSAQVTKIIVKDSRISLSQLSSEYYSNPTEHLKFIGVTGTNGKTTVTYLLRDVLLSDQINKVALIGTTGIVLNNKKLDKSPNTTPESADIHQLTYQLVNDGYNYAVMEVTSHALDQKRVDDCKFDVGIFTNLTYEHLDWHKNMDTYFNSKAHLFELLRPGSTAIVNLNDPYGKKLVQLINNRVNVITYSLSDKNADIFASKVKYDDRGSSYFRLNTPQGKQDIRTNLFGDYNIDNFLSVIGCGIALGININDMLHPLSVTEGAPGRFQRLNIGQNFEVIVDYAHTPDGFEKLFKNIQRIRKRNSSLVVVFGAAGHFRDPSKRPVMGQMASKYADIIILTEEDSRTENTFDVMEMIKDGIDETTCEVHMIEDRAEAIEMALGLAQINDIVLILGKGDEETQEINHPSRWAGDVPTTLRLLTEQQAN